MENSASNPSITQALQAQAMQLLPIITQELDAQDFSEIVHQRIAQQSTEQTQGQHAQVVKTQHIDKTYFQGLTRAQHPQFGSVMIKWQLSDGAYTIAADLTHEADILAAVNASSKIKNNAIAPPLLAHHCVDVQILSQLQRLVIVVTPYYSNGSLASQLTASKHLSLRASQKHHFITQAAYLIANLHQAGWLHNDIKPSNILVEGSDDEWPVDTMSNSLTPRLLLTDFALSQRVTVANSQPNPAGTPAYLAPERWQGQGATVQSDIYAFGVMMVEILTGKRPFQINADSREKSKTWAIQHCQQPIPTLPAEYNHYQYMVDKALAKRVERRYQEMDKILIDLKLLKNS
ncbi:serine/threonine protein kinase [Psychrobacter sp. NPDC078370]|uniref:serine/threonine protein kinase n=1 Tax=unclassified Psychrobacter TaxID=196806 RepID=UPI000C7ECEDB|nr:protein kinase [Psychrobacter sp. MES7-P7E]PLT21266.1 serine/threonine protein kinase [Psychrobacter sp. MES7-P7E]